MGSYGQVSTYSLEFVFTLPLNTASIALHVAAQLFVYLKMTWNHNNLFRSHEPVLSQNISSSGLTYIVPKKLSCEKQAFLLLSKPLYFSYYSSKTNDASCWG